MNFQESLTILNACTKKKSGNLLKASRNVYEISFGVKISENRL